MSPIPDPSGDRAPLSATDFASAVSAISSAFGDPTRRDIYLYVRDTADDPGVTASAVADHFDLHANVARHHLDKLTAGGYIDVAVTRAEGGGAGRPSKRYAVTTPDMPLEVPVRHDDVLVSLLGRALDRLGEDEAAALAEEVGREYGRTMTQGMADADGGPRSFRSALHAVADALTAHGFSSHAKKDGDLLRIVSEHCPFGGAAVEHPVICAVDRGMVAGMLESLYGETSPVTESSLATGADECVTAVAECLTAVAE